jgi:hypothetical protein
MKANMNPQTSLSTLLELTRHMLQVAQAEDWQTLVSLEDSRKDLIAALFAPQLAVHTPRFAEVIREIFAIDQQIITLGEAGRQQAANGMRQLRQANRAMQAYDDGNQKQVA